MFGLHIWRLDDVGSKHLTSSDIRQKNICKWRNIVAFALYIMLESK